MAGWPAGAANYSLKCSAFLAVAAPCLFFAGCDSKNPLSDPLQSKPDARLIGDWQRRDEVWGDRQYYRIETAGDKLPQGVIRFVGMTNGSTDASIDPKREWLAFPTTLAGNSYLNATVVDERTKKLLEEKGWNSKTGIAFFVLKYKVEGDALSSLRWSIAGKSEP
jgi:hypothetical protein